jgi:hypothetical protein
MLVALRLRSEAHDLGDRSATVDCREDTVLGLVDRKGEVGAQVCARLAPAEKPGRRPRRSSLAY